MDTHRIQKFYNNEKHKFIRELQIEVNSNGIKTQNSQFFDHMSHMIINNDIHLHIFTRISEIILLDRQKTIPFVKNFFIIAGTSRQESARNTTKQFNEQKGTV